MECLSPKQREELARAKANGNEVNQQDCEHAISCRHCKNLFLELIEIARINPQAMQEGPDPEKKQRRKLPGHGHHPRRLAKNWP